MVFNERWRLRLCALALAAAFPAAASAGNTGVAFVHGTGNHPDATNEYWTREMIDAVRKGLPNPALYVVVACDFSRFAWAPEASGCLGKQLSAFIAANNITDLVVETHSHGGNMMRWLMSNPTQDSRFPAIIKTIRWVNALAPSSLGTPLADATISGNVFESALGWLLGQQSDAVRMQQVSWMANYNATWMYGTAGRPALPKNFYAVVGTDVKTMVFDSASYCGGYPTQLGLEITQAWLPACSDGFLSCASQAGAGSTWFQDKVRLGGQTLSHNQSRRPCFGLDALLRNDL